MMSTARSSMCGAGIGAALMFVFDPARGARRRALLRDKLVRISHKTRAIAGAAQRDLFNRAAGLGSRTRAILSDEEVDDATIVERVRAALGRATPHHRAISISSTSGWVTLTGDALEPEISSILSVVGAVRGVEGVQNNLRMHVSADRIGALERKAGRSRSKRPILNRSGFAAATAAGIAIVIVAALGRR
jgi:hypothetical protein